MPLTTPVQSKGKKHKQDFSPPSPNMDDTTVKKINNIVDTKLTLWETKFNKMTQELITKATKDISQLTEDFTKTLNTKSTKIIEELQKSKDSILTGVQDIVTEYNTKINSQEKTIQSLSTKLKIETEKRVNLEAYSRQNNLKVFGIPQNTTDIAEFVVKEFKKVLPTFKEWSIDKIHRLPKQGKSKHVAPVLVRFTSHRIKMSIMAEKDKLSQNGFRISNDIPREWQQKRRILWPFVDTAKGLKNPDGSNVEAFIFKDKMVIDKVHYSVENLADLPPPLQPARVYTPMNDDVVLFFTKYSPLSNHHLATFSVDGLSYNCSEQYIMRQKCLLFKNEELAEQIMREPDPVIQKSLANKIENFDAKIWSKNAMVLVRDGIRAKVYQNPYIRDLLVSTGNRKIAEANGGDVLFAIGHHLSDPKAWDQSQWKKAKNLMGRILEKIRTEINNEMCGMQPADNSQTSSIADSDEISETMESTITENA